MNRFFITIIVIFAAIFSTAANAGGPFENWTLEYERSPNLEPGCNTHIGPGCEPTMPSPPPIGAQGCYPNEFWQVQGCRAPVIAIWEVPPDLPTGCANRAGPSCEPADGVPLTLEGCFLNERFILLDANRPWLSGYCMRRASRPINASKPAPILNVKND